MTASDVSDVPIRPAATVVVLRDSPGGLEVLLTVRRKQLRFLGGAVVFPGGAVSHSDLDLRWERASRLSRADAAEALGDRNHASALGAYVCALREAFEEVGFLAGSGPLERIRRADFGRDRSGAAFLESCLELGIVLATDSLVPAGRWVTPRGSPVRFDTRFFLTRAPAGWEPCAQPDEVAEIAWMRPSAALSDLADGRAIMVPPTIDMLERLKEEPDADAALRTAYTGWRWAGEILTERLSPVVGRVVAPNPGLLTGLGTNTYVAGSSGGPTAVIDPAVSEDAFIDSVCALAGDDVAFIVATHRHPDHVGGIEALRIRTGARVRAFGQVRAGGVEVDPLHDGEILEVADVRLRVIHAPGHSPDHVCLFDSDRATLFAGDNVLGEGTAVISPPLGDMAVYLDTLVRLRDLGPQRIYPGHFRPLDDGIAALDRYLAHREERHRAVLATLDHGATLDEIVVRVYADTPKSLHPVALRQVEAMLQLLCRQGLARADGNLWVRRSPE